MFSGLQEAGLESGKGKAESGAELSLLKSAFRFPRSAFVRWLSRGGSAIDDAGL